MIYALIHETFIHDNCIENGATEEEYKVVLEELVSKGLFRKQKQCWYMSGTISKTCQVGFELHSTQ